MSIGEVAPASLPALVPTPCINVCRLDEATGLCLGCARNGDEIAAWAEAGADFKRSVWETLPPRRARLGMIVHRLPWTAEEIDRFVGRTMSHRLGRWVLGAYGASVSFSFGEAGESHHSIAPLSPRPSSRGLLDLEPAAAFAAGRMDPGSACGGPGRRSDGNQLFAEVSFGVGEDVEIVITSGTIAAVTARGALRLIQHEKTIAIAFGSAADPLGPEAIGLVLPRGRVRLQDGVRLDEAAISEAHRRHSLCPVATPAGLAARLYVRSHEDCISREWHSGHSASEFAHARCAVADGDVQAVVETGLGRAEIFAMDESGEGPALDLDAARVAEARELPPPWTLDRVFALGALFYPHGRTSERG